MMPVLMAHRSRLTVSWTPNFAKILDLWHVAVLNAMPRTAAISFELLPSKMSLSTSVSRAVNFLGVGRGLFAIREEFLAAFNDAPAKGSAFAGLTCRSTSGATNMPWMVARCERRC